MKTLQERFDSKYEIVTESGCWIWIGSLFSAGYGALWDNSVKQNRRAHKVSYELHKGGVSVGLCVCHECDTPACVNPDHLFLGTPKDNTEDMLRKGRNSYGERHYNTTLSSEDVHDIRVLLNQGHLNQSQIGRLFSVGNTTISMIKTGNNRRLG